MLLRLKEQNVSGYYGVEQAIIRKLGEIPPESLLVQIRTKHREDEEWRDITELLIQEGTSDDPKWIWESDWWEGEQFVDLVAVAKIWQVDISEDFAFEE